MDTCNDINRGMQQMAQAIESMIEISAHEIHDLLDQCSIQKVNRYTALIQPGEPADRLFFINRGLIRLILTDPEGTAHSMHFAMEEQFIADYSAFLLRQPALYTLQTEEETEVVVLPRTAIEWGYRNLKQGDRLGRLIAEFYFVYQDNRLQNQYSRTPKERYDRITQVFPNIHNRVPQHMIASYLGITPIHLSRLKKAAYKEI